MKSGYTTGACAAAGVKAALLFEAGKNWQTVTLTALDGTELTIPVKAVARTEAGICAEVVKFSGDDPDITDGVSVFTTVRHVAGGAMTFAAGEGIGTVTKPGLSVPVGEPSINPGPRELMRRAACETIGTSDGLHVTIAIPAGKKLAEKTLNPVLGVKGGGIRIDGKLRAFSLGKLINEDMAVIHIEKADESFEGIYSVINQQFAEHEWSGVKYINREEDMGIEGLRKAKLSYRPVELIQKYVAKPALTLSGRP